MTILVTGAAGYIGSHMLVALLERGHQVIALDNHVNSLPAVYERVARITERTFEHFEVDVRDAPALTRLLAAHPVDACFHFAGLKSVTESMVDPLRYFDFNVNGLISLLGALRQNGTRRFIFSSSATVYAEQSTQPLHEMSVLGPQTVYGLTKLQGEKILESLSQIGELDVAVLRYFNPVAAHPSGLLGELPLGPPNNLMPFVTQVAAGLREQLQIFGNDYPTRDGTCIRDYIHVQDLVAGHLAALERLTRAGRSFTVNLGNGHGTSVCELVENFERVNQVNVPRRFAARRTGDIAQYWADPALAHQLLGWRASCDLDQMCRDAWNWQSSLSGLR
ncbi:MULTISPECIES: UDP-glucose 4-epimerase GalE [unclassified Polaromonas]|uniref:UDP-glucose 4-epimerase GalE n=1 Tax=unclassified Polaromonas TaxID=2638319 RepID=UPI000F08D161|nr:MULTISPECIES: UDP-glucose 4-epimerase GalE [unclassified Polaromonas]AYQ27919.1 UDP-glucose 4-epimerase GalE [Polaromonas sp. SP1]QGJ17220.1 UDP-glucose 4-epimerase GalE [Polaromonas sp. Pch-P]